MTGSQFALLRSRRFLPLFVTQFLGALNDNFFKNAFVILLTYRLAQEAGLNGQVLVTAAAGLFILPFFLFSATAGFLADKFEKRRLILAVKIAEIVFMAIAIAGFTSGHVVLLFTVLFLMRVHSTFFGPIKYGILPAHLVPDELLASHALIEAGTLLAILIRSIRGDLRPPGPARRARHQPLPYRSLLRKRRHPARRRAARHRRLPRPPRRLAHRRRPNPHRCLRRRLHRAALYLLAGAQRGEPPLA